MFASQYVEFKIEDETFALDVSKIKEIINYIPSTKVPNVPEFIEGVINMRGVVYAIVNLRNKFHYPKKELNEKVKIMLVKIEGMIVGIVVDEVTGMLKVEEKDIENTPQLISSKYVNAEFIQGIIKQNDSITIILDIDKVIESAA